MPHKTPPQPWHGFLLELDQIASGEVHLHCLGGFVVTQVYGLQRPTVDVDVLSIAPIETRLGLLEKGRQGSALHKKYRVYLDFVTIASYPEDYENRLTEMYPGVYARLRLFALDPYDLALAKLSRNIDRDRGDVKHLARTVPLDLDVLRQRYRAELRPNHIGDQKLLDDYFQLWVEMIEEDRSSRK